MGTVGRRDVSVKRLAFFAVLVGAVCLASGWAVAQTAKPDRQVAVTIDDLPAGMADRLPAADITAMTAKLLGTLRDQKIPVVGFVNEKKLYKPGEVDERIKALQMWLDYGFELGNHTFSHASLNQVGLKAWEDEVIQGESVTKHAAGGAQNEAAVFSPSLSRYRARPADATRGRSISRRSRLPHCSHHARRLGLDVRRTLRRRQEAQRHGMQQANRERLSRLSRRGVRIRGAAFRQGCRLRAEADSAAARQQPGSGPHRRIAGRASASAAIASSRSKTRWKIRPTACPTLTSAKKAPAGSITGRSRRGRFRRVRRNFPSG